MFFRIGKHLIFLAAWGSPIRKQSQRISQESRFPCLVCCRFFSIKNRSKRYIACSDVAQKEGFEPSRRFYPPYSLSRGAPSASWVLLQTHMQL